MQTPVWTIIINLVESIRQGPILLTWFNFNPNMDK